MPAAATKSRRRRTQRAPSSDIEEEIGSQRDADDVDNENSEEEDAQPVRKTVAVKKEKKRKLDQSDADAPEAGPSNSIDDDDSAIDIENFHDQPLDKKDGAKLLGISQDWEMIRKQVHQNSFRNVKDVAISLADIIEVGEAGKELDEVDSIMKIDLDVDHALRSHEATLNNIYQALMRGEVVEKVLEMYERELKRRMDEYNSKTTRQKYAPINTYVEFKQGIYEVQYPGEAIPPINDLVPREDGDASNDEDELEVGGVTQDYKCPITLMILEDPMTSQVCGHSYSRAAIQEFLQKAGRDGKPCPAAGCNKRITMNQLNIDRGLEKRVKIANRRLRRQQESDEGEDEVIE